MMKRALLPLGFAALMAACVHPVPVSTAAPFDFETEPLEARLSPIGGLSFYVNRPAHVAIFEIAPGRGTSMLYPMSSYEVGMLHDGLHRPIDTFSRGMGRWYYLSDPFGTQWMQPRILFLVASVEPLRVEPLVQAPGAVRSLLGFQHFATANSYQTINRLIDAVVPVQPESDWATDTYVIWPPILPPRATLANVMYIRCANGRVIAVPVWYGALRCPGDQLSVAERDPDADSGDVSGKKPEQKPPRILPLEPGAGRATESTERTSRFLRGIDRPSKPTRAGRAADRETGKASDRSSRTPITRPGGLREAPDEPRRAAPDRAKPAPAAPQRRERERSEPQRSAPPRSEPASRQPRSEPTRREPVTRSEQPRSETRPKDPQRGPDEQTR